MIRYPTSESKPTAKDVDNLEEIQRKYLKNKQQKKKREINGRHQQQQKQEQEDISSNVSSPSVSFTYDPPEYDDHPMDQVELGTKSSYHTNTSDSSQQQKHHPKGIKRPVAEPESNQRKPTTHEQRARITRQRLGIDQQTSRK